MGFKNIFRMTLIPDIFRIGHSWGSLGHSWENQKGKSKHVIAEEMRPDLPEPYQEQHKL